MRDTQTKYQSPHSHQVLSTTSLNATQNLFSTGMPGTIFPDSLILFNNYPPPREVFDAIMKNGFTFIGAGPFDPSDLWFLKKVLC